MLAGAQFIVSPALNIRTIELCRRYNVAVFPGGLTPTEVVTAWEAGADAVKVFPCSAMGGASYLKALKAPLPQIELIPTGGVSLATAAEFSRRSALALWRRWRSGRQQGHPRRQAGSDYGETHGSIWRIVSAHRK